MCNRCITLIRYALFYFIFFNSSYVSADEIEKLDTKQCIIISQSCNALSVKGDYYKVINVIYEQDFKDVMTNEIGKSNPNDSALINIDNYEFSITKDVEKNRYYVGVGATTKIGSVPVLIGSIHYIVDAATMKIIDKYRRH